MSKEFQIRDGNLIASFDLENEDGDIDFCKLLKVSHGVADEIGMFVDYVATNKIIKDQSKKISDLEAKLAEKDKENLTLFSMLYETLEKQGCENIASTIEQMTGWTYDKEADWLKGNRNYDQLKQQLHDLPNKIVEEIRKEIEFPLYVHPDFDEFECLFDIDKLLDTILEKYEDKDESNND